MISERQFSEQFSGFWTQCLPFLTPKVVAEMNVQVSPMPDSRGFVAKPLKPTEDPSNNDIVADIGFGIFAAAIQSGKSVYSIRTAEIIQQISKEALKRITRLRSIEGKVKAKGLHGTVDAFDIATRLEDFFVAEGEGVLKIQPRFKGCGILDSCYGDLLMGETLYEVKCVERNLRSIDIRQVLTYCTLNYLSHQYKITEVCIVNPRRGISFRFGVESLAQQAAGKNAAELFHQIGAFLMNYETIQLPS